MNNKDYLVYNENYIKKAKSSFTNFNNTVKDNIIEVKKQGNNEYYIEIETNNNLIDLNNINFNIYKNLFDFATNNNIIYLDSIVLRSSIAFEFENDTHDIIAIFNKVIPSSSFINKKISIKKLAKIQTIIITKQ
jgi:hypothetical protein